MSEESFLRSINDVLSVITPIDATSRFPEVVDELVVRYGKSITAFCEIITSSQSSEDVLRRIRSPSIDSTTRMALLKMYRRCVAPILDTETTKKIQKVDTEELIAHYGHTFKPISKLHRQFATLPKEYRYALAALVGEYDTRGQLGYALTGIFFDWFEHRFAELYAIAGPRGAGPDIELSKLFPKFSESFPCDFVVTRAKDEKVLAVGFARYDSTRGGAQSDDRTGGNANKIAKVRSSHRVLPSDLKLLFLCDGPGLAHRDTWEEACLIDGQLNGRVRVTTLKLATSRVSPEWLEA